MNYEQEMAVDEVMADMFVLFKKHQLNSVEIVTFGTIIAGGMAAAGEMNKKFYMEICEHAYDSAKNQEPKVMQ